VRASTHPTVEKNGRRKMNDWQLPPELEGLERQLAERSALQPNAELRRRIASGVNVQLRRERRLDSWRFAITVALVVGVWINLSLCAAQDTYFHFRLGDGRPSVEQTARQIQELLPELSESETRREAMLLQSSAYLVMQPQLDVKSSKITQLALPQDLQDLLE
jgi:hypothetical protein